MEVPEFFTFNDAQIGIAPIKPYSETATADIARFTNMIGQFKHQRRMNEWLSSRLLLEKVTNKSFDKITYSPEGKPYCLDGSKISISHSKQMAAVIWHPSCEVGIDVDELRPQVQKIKHKFLSDNELKMILPQHAIETLTAFWCAKEALFKLYGLKELQFNQHIVLQHADLKVTEGLMQGSIEAKIEKHSSIIYANVQIVQSPEYMLAYVVSDVFNR